MFSLSSWHPFLHLFIPCYFFENITPTNRPINWTLYWLVSELWTKPALLRDSALVLSGRNGWSAGIHTSDLHKTNQWRLSWALTMLFWLLNSVCSILICPRDIRLSTPFVIQKTRLFLWITYLVIFITPAQVATDHQQPNASKTRVWPRGLKFLNGLGKKVNVYKFPVRWRDEDSTVRA